MTDTNDTQHTHFWFMSLTKPHVGTGMGTHHRAGTVTPRIGATRLELFSTLRTYVDNNWPELVGAAVIAFDIQPNQL